jgi:hypothetical protein
MSYLKLAPTRALASRRDSVAECTPNKGPRQQPSSCSKILSVAFATARAGRSHTSLTVNQCEERTVLQVPPDVLSESLNLLEVLMFTFRSWPMWLSNQFELVTVRVLEVDPAAAAEVIDLT